MKPSAAAILGLALAMASALPADARTHRKHGPRPQYSAQPFAPYPQPRPACLKLCARDRQPCDPIYFKTADGRCNPDNDYY